MKPATPLPWRRVQGMVYAPQNAPILTLAVEDYVFGTGHGRAHEREDNIAYLLHACNNYPRLVAELKRLCVEIPKKIGSKEPFKNDLLRELGEDK